MAKQAHSYPASYAQERIWLLDKYRPGTSVFNMSAAYGISGPLNIPTLQKTVNEIAARHETLRTAFTEEQGSLLQVVGPKSSLPLCINDLQPIPDAQRDAYLAEAVEAEVLRPFDLARGPLIRACIFVMRPAEYVLTLTMHQIISDRRSMSLLLREIGLLYAAFSSGQPSPLEDLPIQY